MIDYCHQSFDSFSFHTHPTACPTYNHRRNSKSSRSQQLALYTLDNSPSNKRSVSSLTTSTKMKTKAPLVVVQQQQPCHAQHHQYTHYEPLFSYSHQYHRHHSQQQRSVSESTARRRSQHAKQSQQTLRQYGNISPATSSNRSSQCASPLLSAIASECTTSLSPLSSSPSTSAAGSAKSRTATGETATTAAAMNNRMSYSAIVQSTSFQGNNFRKATSRMAAQITRTHPQRSHSSSSLPDMQGKHGYYHSRLQHHDYEEDLDGHPHWDDSHAYYNSAQPTQHLHPSQSLYTHQHDNGAASGQKQHLYDQQQQQHQRQQYDLHNYSNYSQYPPLGAAYHSPRRSRSSSNSSQNCHRSHPYTSSTLVPASSVLSTVEATDLPEETLQHSSTALPAAIRVSSASLSLSHGGENGLLQRKTLDDPAAVAVNSDPEPCLDATIEQPAFQANVHELSHSHPIDASDRNNASDSAPSSQSPRFLSVSESLQRGVDSDQASLFSSRETSDSDDERSQGSVLDSFEDQLGHNAKRSKKARSLHRLLRKNRMLESSLAQAQRDLQQERESRKIVDECHLKTKEDLLQRLADKDDENERLIQELEEARKQVVRLQQQSYKIGYDSSSYSLSSGLANIGGGLMLHHSSLISSQDDSDEFFLPSSIVASTRTSSSVGSATSNAAATTETVYDTPARSHEPLIYGTSDDEDEDGSKKDSANALGAAADSSVDSATRFSNFGSHTNSRDHEDLINEPPATRKDDVMTSPGPDSSYLSQDGGICFSESFESLAQSHLQQAIVAKLTTAMTILQLDDLAMKFEASPQDLLAVLISEMAKWWEMARLKAGGPIKGGWGPMTPNSNGKGITNKIRESVESDFRQYFGPLLFHYVTNHQDQLLLLKRLEEHSSMSVILRENQPFQLMAMFKCDILDRDAILEWWRLLEEPKQIFDHGQDIRNLTAKFIAFLETQMEDEDEDDSEDEFDNEEESDEDDSDDLDEEDEDDEVFPATRSAGKGSVRILGLEQLNQTSSESPKYSSTALNGDASKLANGQLSSSPEMLVIGSEDGEDDRSTTSSLERLEARERERRISFCAHTTVFGEDSSDEGDDEEEGDDDEVATESTDEQETK